MFTRTKTVKKQPDGSMGVSVTAHDSTQKQPLGEALSAHVREVMKREEESKRILQPRKVGDLKDPEEAKEDTKSPEITPDDLALIQSHVSVLEDEAEAPELRELAAGELIDVLNRLEIYRGKKPEKALIRARKLLEELNAEDTATGESE